MRALNDAWLLRLRSNTAKAILVTIDPSGRFPMMTPHLALEPGTLTASTDRDLRTQRGIEVEHAASGRSIPFPPFVAEWPVVAKTLSPLELRADIAQVTIQIASHRQFLERLGLATNATIRLDLWADGIDLAQAIPLFAGRTIGNARVDLESGTATMTFADGNPRALAQFPALLSREEFPDAPEDVVDRVAVPVIFLNYPERTVCQPISMDRKRYIVQAGIPYRRPSRVERGGVAVTSGWHFQDSKTATHEAPFLELVFDEAPSEIQAGLNNLVSVSGGIGIVAQNPIEYLSAIAGVPLDPQSKALLSLSDFDFDSVHATQGNALDLVTRRFAGQIGMAFAQDMHRGRLFHCATEPGGMTIRVGSELLCSLAAEWARSPDEQIVNDLNVGCGRDHFGSSDGASPLVTVKRNGSIPSSAMSLQAASRSTFGRRFQSYPGNDLVVDRDPATGMVVGCRAGERLGNQLGALLAFPQMSMPYLARWDCGVLSERGDSFRLVDHQYDIDADCKVIQWSLPASGPELVLAVRQVS